MYYELGVWPLIVKGGLWASPQIIIENYAEIQDLVNDYTLANVI